jgi:hypothetical protein
VCINWVKSFRFLERKKLPALGTSFLRKRSGEAFVRAFPQDFELLRVDEFLYVKISVWTILQQIINLKLLRLIIPRKSVSVQKSAFR